MISISFYVNETFEQAHDKTNKMACAPSEDSDQPGHPPSDQRFRFVPNGS